MDPTPSFLYISTNHVPLQSVYPVYLQEEQCFKIKKNSLVIVTKVYNFNHSNKNNLVLLCFIPYYISHLSIKT